MVGHAAHIPDIESRIVSSEVTALTFESLCRRNRVERVDLLLIDTEGHDWQILRSIDLDRHRPRLVIYEHYHLSARDRAAAREHLARHGYETMEEGFDTFCLDVSERGRADGDVADADAGGGGRGGLRGGAVSAVHTRLRRLVRSRSVEPHPDAGRG